jgi:hypothetical protein
MVVGMVAVTAVMTVAVVAAATMTVLLPLLRVATMLLHLATRTAVVARTMNPSGTKPGFAGYL